ncbi:MAG: NAD-dependent epimerase/dehydratase family protein [Bacteroidetes bacterium]|nr:NAD-dependent epimerase/dehydratase family protein [Bacteroidota bacterium]MBU1577934.1 NAD-dependent epimerase/dehydratase family protein [Bacteroidota bacterium]MBU2556581.1 NAD-dependent epimerase/dehydratase family protein [Bacteroidota bacterium]
MRIHLVSGACGFVGRNMVKRLSNTTQDKVFMIDDLSIGRHPSEWMDNFESKKQDDLEIIGKDERLFFWKGDFRNLLFYMRENPCYIQEKYGIDFERFSDVFHFAAIVGGRMKIEGDPMMVALDLSIDAEFFYWITQHKPERVLYPSSSAAYPISLQTTQAAVALSEGDIDFQKNLGTPDMTYGWSKLTGEFLAQIAAKHYGVPVVCIRPFSGYGEDQELSYPVPAIAARAAKKEDPFEVWGSGKQGRDFVHIDDVIDFIFVLLDNVNDGSAYNIGSGRLTSFLELIDVFSDIAGYKPQIKPLLDKPVGVHSRYANMDLVDKTFGWKPKISLREGMTRVYEKQLKNLK